MPPKSKRVKTAAAAVSVPQSREQAAEQIAKIGQDSRTLARLEADMNDALAEVKRKFEDEAEPIRQRIADNTQGLQTWADANRDTLTQGGKVKTAALTTGQLLWRTRPPSVRITGADSVIDALRKLGLGRFVRVKDEVNKEAILNEPAAVAHVPGIAISQGEDFVVEPFEASLVDVAGA